MERQFIKIIATTGLVKLAGIVLLANYFGHVGVGFAALIEKTIDAIASYVLIIRKNLNPFQKYLINPPNF
ncbi:hypothetical protein ACFL45_08785 [Candidatus Neomarinimicrobiota bacterium]